MVWYAANNVQVVPKDKYPPNTPELRSIEKKCWVIIKRNLKKTKKTGSDEISKSGSPTEYFSWIWYYLNIKNKYNLISQKNGFTNLYAFSLDQILTVSPRICYDRHDVTCLQPNWMFIQVKRLPCMCMPWFFLIHSRSKGTEYASQHCFVRHFYNS